MLRWQRVAAHLMASGTGGSTTSASHSPRSGWPRPTPSRCVRLTELPTGDRAPVIAEYIRRAVDRSGPKAAERANRSYFGLGPDASLEDIEAIVDHYPVFRITYEH